MKNKIYIFMMILFLVIGVKAEGEATIKNIKVNGVECTCSGYDCAVDVLDSSATITYDLVDQNAKVDRLSGFKVDLLSEVTTIKLTVTNGENEEKVENIYNLTINKQEKENDLSLKSLKVNGEDIKVSNDIVAYSYICEYTTTAINLEVVPNDTSASVIKKDSYDFPLEDSSISIDFSIKPLSGEQLDYRVVVTRAVKPDSNLKTLKINDKDIALEDNKYDYEYQVEYSINELKIDAIPENKDAKVEIENKTLVVGENTINITVTNDKVQNVYHLLVIREENIDKSVANLKELKIDEYKKLDFKENVLDYTISFSEIPSKLTIHAEGKDADSEVEIIGNEDLHDGSNILIKVTLGNIVREYTLQIKEIKNISDNKSMILFCIIGLVITIGILLFLEIRSKKHKKRAYLKKIIDLRHKVERKRKEEAETKKISKNKHQVKVKKNDEDEIEII